MKGMEGQGRKREQGSVTHLLLLLLALTVLGRCCLRVDAAPSVLRGLAGSTRRWREEQVHRLGFQPPHIPRRSAIANVQASSDCTWEYLTSPCPDVRALLAFKAANLDPFGALHSWSFPCTPSRPQATQCPALATIICSSWKGINCTTAAKGQPVGTPRVSSLAVSMGGDLLLWGNFSLGFSIPPEVGDMVSLQYLNLALNKDPETFMGGLIGPIPDNISRLTGLSYLNLAYNYLWGPLPSSLGALTGLSFLDLHNNNFTGAIPPSLSALTRLTMLNLGYNKGLSGSIPSQLGSLQLLQQLSLSVLDMQGPIPDTFSKLTNVSSLDMHSVGLTGPVPTWVGQAWGASLQYLNLAYNHLSGTLPSALGQLSELKSLTLTNNSLSGPLSTPLIAGLCNASRADGKVHKSLNMLNGLGLAFNQFNGSIPLGLGACASVENMILSYNNFSGPFPPLSFFSGLAGMGLFDVSNNQLEGLVPPAILKSNPVLTGVLIQNNRLTGPMPLMVCAATPAVITFNASGNMLTGSLDQILGDSSLPSCKTSDTPPAPTMLQFDFSFNRLNGSVPAFTLGMPSMQQLYLDGNTLSGPLQLPPSFNCSAQLQTLTASNNLLSGPIPSALAKCTALQMLHLASNQLTGPIPDELSAIGTSLQSLMLQGNMLSGGVPTGIDSFQNLAYLHVSHNSLSLPLPQALTRLTNLQVLDVSNNQISGPIPDAIGNLTVLKFMDASDNALSGSIPTNIAPPLLPLLTFLNLSNNFLSGGIPWGFANSTPANITLDFSGNALTGPLPGGATSPFSLSMPPNVTADNAGLCGAPGYPDCSSGSSLSTGEIVGIAVGAFVGLVLIVVGAWLLLRTRSDWAGGTMMVFEKLDFPLTIDDILQVTENFSDKFKLGRGGFGTVYRATLQDGRTVAIKRLAAQSTQGDREFQAEMQTLGNIRHRNLVVLVAAYIAPAPSSERLLVYNFLSGGSLDNILSADKDMPKDSPYRQWEVRRRIALDVARGMKYLHHDCTPRIIHRDMKPANVLMDDQLVAHVADFGLAREIDATKSHMSTAVFGTIGYLAPEYTQRGRLTFKSDVFAYGVLLLQLISGKQPTDEDVAERGLARWVGASATASIIDPRMDIGPYVNQILGAIKLGLLCTSRVAADRPSMAEVVHLLENLDDFAKGITTEGYGSS